jgi:hypothetical protein
VAVVFHPDLTPLLVPIDRVAPFPRNPRVGDVDAIVASMEANGVYQPVVAQRSTGYVLAGNHRLHALHALHADQVPVVWVDVDDDRAARLALVDNRTADLASYDAERLLDLLADLDGTTMGLLGTGYDHDDLDSILATVAEAGQGAERAAELEVGSAAVPVRRTVPLDLFFSGSCTSAEAMVAVRMGWQVGSISTAAASVRALFARHPNAARLGFMDNDWHDYDHAAHVAACKEFGPRYATTRDLLTKAQAQAAGVEWYSFDDTMAMAADVAAAGVDNVVVIPKYAAAVDRIPATIGDARVVLGYSVPTSYGGTPVPSRAFVGRPVHLLGGSWAKQRAYLNVLGDDVVSLDNNYLLRIAEFGQCYLPDGSVRTVWDVADFISAASQTAYLPAIALSLASIVQAVREQYGVPVTPTRLGDDADDAAAPMTTRDDEGEP